MKHLKSNHYSHVAIRIFKAAMLIMLITIVMTASVTITASTPAADAPKVADTCRIATFDEITATAPTTEATSESTTVESDTTKVQETTTTTTPPVETTSGLDVAELAQSCAELEVYEETYNYSEDTLLLAKVIYLEAGTCSSQCQWLVGSTAMNLADEYGDLSAVAYNYSMFNVAYLIDSCDPSDESIAIAEQILSGDRDSQVKAFKTDSYHDWATPYTEVDNVYFSVY